MSRVGRPRNDNGSLYLRKDSRVWQMGYWDDEGRYRQESTGQRDKAEAQKVLRRRLVDRDAGRLPGVEQSGLLTFNQWADWFLANRSKPPSCSPKTHAANENALKFLRPRFGMQRLQDITTDDVEVYLRTRLNTRKRVHTRLGIRLGSRLKPSTVNQEFRVLRHILNQAVKKRRLLVNPCNGAEFPVKLSGTTRKPHVLTASEQERLEAAAPVHLRNIITIMCETGLRPYRELIPMRKTQVDLANRLIHIPDSKTVAGVADMPMTDRAREAFVSQMRASLDSEFLFPNTSTGRPLTTVRKMWDRALQKAGLPHFALYELRHTFATRLSAGGVADRFVTQMLRQSDAAVFKRYSQANLSMMREALAKLDRQAGEHDTHFLTALAS